MACMSVWVSKSLTVDNNTYDVAINDQEYAKSYWGVGFSPRFRILQENREDNTYRAEDIVQADELESPKGRKLKNLFINCIGDPPCYDDPMASDDSLRTLHVFYLNIEIIDSMVLGRTYIYKKHAFIVMTTRAINNVFPHEFGHALYFTNYMLKGKDPISNDKHNNDPNNLMYYQLKDETMILEQKQLDAKKFSYLTNPHVIHDTPPFMNDFSID